MPVLYGEGRPDDMQKVEEIGVAVTLRIHLFMTKGDR